MDNQEETVPEMESKNTEDETNKFLDFDNFPKFYEEFTNKIKETVSSAAKVPLKENDLEYFLTVPSFKTFMQSQNDRILKLMGQTLKQQNIKKSNFHSAKLDNEERMDLLIDINDQIIEKLGIQLDEIQGLRKKTETELKLSATTLNLTSRNINTSWNKDMGMVINKALIQDLGISTNKHQVNAAGGHALFNRKGVVQKSQLFFMDKIDNSNLPFLPKIRQKPNALRPLPEIFSKLNEPNFELKQEVYEENLELLENPYLYEIGQLQLNEEDFKLVPEPVPEPQSLEKTAFKYIDKLDDLIWLCDYLGKNNRSQIKEIAVDLEHHSYRSFLGFTCLMQISTRDQDFVIDTIKLRSEMQRLNEIFTDWTLLKVLHGSDFDIEWLQKDFGIYVVNMFDTGQASRVLQYPHFSLSYLLQRFCGVNAQKHYQLADWRQRPLAEGMLRYAREDTHYLLYIYDKLKNELITQIHHTDNQTLSQSNLALVYEKSKVITKKCYKKPMFYSKGFLTLCQNNSHLNPKQMKALRDLYRWRDKIARESDESCEFVLKNHQLLKIAELLPREIYGILALCNPISSIVEVNVHEMHEIIKTAREFTGSHSSVEVNESEKTLNSLLEDRKAGVNSTAGTNVLDSIVHSVTYDPDSILNCPHDFPHNSENANDSMETDNNQLISDVNAIETAIRSSLADLLIKPASKQDLSLPIDLDQTGQSVLKMFFDKNHKKNQILNEKKTQKLQEKISEIKESIKNPFEMFLPADFRLSKIGSDECVVWNLLKPVNKSIVSLSELSKAEVEVVVEKKDNDIFMIPLKKQFKLEKNGDKKLKKKLKDVDFTDAIIQFNKSKVEKIDALGADNGEEEENEQEKFNKISDKVKDNLKSLSELVKKANISKNKKGRVEEGQASSETIENVATEVAEFKYDAVNMNQLFAKPEKPKFDGNGKSRKTDNRFGKVNKRRATNAVTRNKHNKSHTFKSGTD